MHLNKEQTDALTLLILFIIYIEMAILTWIIVLPNFIAGIISLSILSFGMLGLLYNRIWGEIEKNGEPKRKYL